MPLTLPSLKQAAAGAGSSSSSGTNANNAAGAAATPSAIPGFSATAEGDLVWNCGSCGERNFFWREFCGRCKRPCANPYGSDKLSQTRKVTNWGGWCVYVCAGGGVVWRCGRQLVLDGVGVGGGDMTAVFSSFLMNSVLILLAPAPFTHSFSHSLTLPGPGPCHT